MKFEIAAGLFIENAEFSVHPFLINPQGNMYGTSFKSVQDVLSAKKNVVLDIDVQGVKQLKSSGKLSNILYIFICPPNLEELEKRLRARGTEVKLFVVDKRMPRVLQSGWRRRSASLNGGMWREMLMLLC
jgi:guanylate kinase